jgi:hypothetical protein
MSRFEERNGDRRGLLILSFSSPSEEEGPGSAVRSLESGPRHGDGGTLGVGWPGGNLGQTAAFSPSPSLPHRAAERDLRPLPEATLAAPGARTNRDYFDENERLGGKSLTVFDIAFVTASPSGIRTPVRIHADRTNRFSWRTSTCCHCSASRPDRMTALAAVAALPALDKLSFEAIDPK